jgi:hypothetical protein
MARGADDRDRRPDSRPGPVAAGSASVAARPLRKTAARGSAVDRAILLMVIAQYNFFPYTMKLRR